MRYLHLVLIFLVLQSSYSQTKEEIQLCLAVQSNNFSSNSEANVALERILNVIGAARNFILTPCNQIDNALATSYKGTRYILYDKEFMSLINSRTNDWSSLFILAHEVGHHINGHSLDLILYAGGVIEPSSLVESRRQELEADEFAGFILSKLGASLAETQEAIKLISSDEDDSNSTHPSRNKRLSAIELGFNKAKDIFETPKEYTVDKNSFEYKYYLGLSNLFETEDYYESIFNFKEAISINPSDGFSYFYLSEAYRKLNDYSNTLKTLNEIIYVDDELNPHLIPGISFKRILTLPDAFKRDSNGTPGIVFSSRAEMKTILGDIEGAYGDYLAVERIYRELNDKVFLGSTLRSLADLNWKLYRDYDRAITFINFAIYNDDTSINRYSRGQFYLFSRTWKTGITDNEIIKNLKLAIIDFDMAIENFKYEENEPKEEYSYEEAQKWFLAKNYEFIANAYMFLWADEDNLKPSSLYGKKYSENYEKMYFNGGRNDFLSEQYLKSCD